MKKNYHSFSPLLALGLTAALFSATSMTDDAGEPGPDDVDDGEGGDDDGEGEGEDEGGDAGE